MSNALPDLVNQTAKINEVIKCKSDVLYFIEHYIRLPDGRNIILKDWQSRYLKHISNGKDAVLSDDNHSGKTLLSAIYAIWSAMFNPNRRITFMTKNKQYEIEVLSFMEKLVKCLPDWMVPTYRIDKSTYRKSSLIFESNGSIIVISGADGDFCGYCPGDVLILDDFASFSDKGFENTCDVIPVLKGGQRNGGQMIMSYSPSNMNNSRFSEFIANNANTIFMSKED